MKGGVAVLQKLDVRKMELASKARYLVAAFLGCGTEGSELEEAGVNHKQTRSPHQGDLFFSRKTASRVKEKLQEMVPVLD